MMKRILFFATPDDIVPVLQRLEALAPLKFVELGNLTTPNRPIYLSAAEIPNPGIAKYESGIACSAYMVSHRDTKNHMHKFVEKTGEARWALDNGDNEETTVLNLGGLWQNSVLLPGQMDTLHTKNPIAQQLMKWFLAALKKENFTKIESWWLGKEALAMLKAGKRLTTTAVQSPPEFDLQLPAP